LCGVTPSEAHATIAPELLYNARDVAVTMWMTSHTTADAHMPFHCDNRFLASSTDDDDDDKLAGAVHQQKAHGKMENCGASKSPPCSKRRPS
jgi:hypothetical protein